MRKESIFTGAATAIVTPMNAKGVDYEAFERMLNWQVQQGIDALVVCGTTGEGSTLTDEEHRQVLQFAIKVVDGRVPMIAAIKEASGNISKIVETAALVGDQLDIYSGNDDQIVPILACGGKGVISVLSNVVPAETSLMCKKFFAGDVQGAMEMQKKYLPLTNALFCEVNPIPAKAAAAAMGYGENYVRLPLVTMEETARQHLLECMREVGVNV